MGCGGLRILNRGGEPITDEGQDMPVMEIEVVGSFHVHEKLKLFYFKWICRKVECITCFSDITVHNFLL